MAVAIILAAGSGSRMNSDVAKQYMKLNNREIVSYAIETFNRHPEINKIALVAREHELEYCKKEIVDRYGFNKVRILCAGGEERYLSVYNGLNSFGTLDEDEIVIVHDGARPFVTAQMITDVIAAAKENGAATTAMPVKDTIKIIDAEGFGIETPERKFVYQIQTPQAFTYSIMSEAYATMFAESEGVNYKITDDTMLVEQYKGVRSKMVSGSYENIKITTPDDLKIASIFV